MLTKENVDFVGDATLDGNLPKTKPTDSRKHTQSHAHTGFIPQLEGIRAESMRSPTSDVRSVNLDRALFMEGPRMHAWMDPGKSSTCMAI